MGGGDKPLLDVGGSSMLVRVIAALRPDAAAIAISANGDPARFAAFAVPVLPDGDVRGGRADCRTARRPGLGRQPARQRPADRPRRHAFRPRRAGNSPRATARVRGNRRPGPPPRHALAGRLSRRPAAPALGPAGAATLSTLPVSSACAGLIFRWRNGTRSLTSTRWTTWRWREASPKGGHDADSGHRWPRCHRP